MPKYLVNHSGALSRASLFNKFLDDVISKDIVNQRVEIRENFIENHVFEAGLLSVDLSAFYLIVEHALNPPASNLVDGTFVHVSLNEEAVHLLS